MTPDRWKRISQLYEATRTRPASERRVFLEEACAGDASLQGEVETLLDQPTSPPALEALTPAAVFRAVGHQTGAEMTGRRFGGYLVHELIGKGGMGDVYRARDTKLGRDVALKVLPQVFANDADRLARFEREARLLASLDHPHIGTIHGIEESEGLRALVLALVEGDTLTERLVRGPLSVSHALEYARQIADALEAAHDKGIIHRDLKPANIKITPGGVVKVLDFGLAKSLGGAADPAVQQSPTLTMGGTGEGVILGTAAYMSPEQARGYPVDKRTDIWAFGCVLYEMLTGRDAFAGQTRSDTLAAILERDPDLHALPVSTPPTIRRLLKRCFEKDQKRRLRDIGEARIEVEDAQHATDQPAPPPIPDPSWMRLAALLSVVLLGVAAVFLLWTRGRVAPSNASGVARVLVDVSPADGFGPGAAQSGAVATRTDVALSPDGTLLVFSAQKDGRQQLYLRALNRLEATPIAGTEDSNSPFFSPDGQWLGFWAGALEVGAIGELKKVRFDGSPAVTVARVAPLRGATWGVNDIMFATVGGAGGLWRVPAAGGTPERLTHPSPDAASTIHSLPHSLPDERGVLFTIGSAGSGFADGRIAVMSGSSSEPHVVLDQGVDARYVSSGHLVYIRDGTLMAAPFDLNELRVTGIATPIVEGIMQAVRTRSLSLTETGAAQFSVSDTGQLVYVPSVAIPDSRRSLVWVSRDGTVMPTTVPAGNMGAPRLSPNGQQVVLFSRGRGLLIHDFARGGLRHVAPYQGAWSTWTRDGKQITISEGQGFASMSIEGGVTARLAVDTAEPNTAGWWSPDGKTLLYTRLSSSGAWEIRTVSRTEGDRRVHPAREAVANERYPQFSPDGEWFVYTSNESGRDEVYVERYRGAERHQISADGGTAPAWAPNGRELFYVTINGERTRMMSVDITMTPTFSFGIPRALFEGQYPPGTPHRNYDVSRDGRFIMLHEQGMPVPAVTQMVLVLNWLDELRRLVPREDRQPR